MKLLSKNSFGCPYLFLAPMEGVGDRIFRKAISHIGGFDEAVTEFIRVPRNAHVVSLAKHYIRHEIAPIPLAAQIMGSDPELMALMAQEIERRGAPRIDLNCGCPSSVVTGRGAGSSLLKDPNLVYTVAKAMVDAVEVPVTIKMRSGYEDTSLFKENILAAQESGVQFITLHPRTKVDGYGPAAKWEYIALAKELLQIPVVGNGDILTVDDAIKMLHKTRCDALMIGRGSVINPFLFHEIKAHFACAPYTSSWEMLIQFIAIFINELPKEIAPKGKVSKLKQILSFLFKKNETLLHYREKILTFSSESIAEFSDYALSLLKKGWNNSEIKTSE